ncbi:MAG: SDR family oxidoreductase [Calditrichia bacterium]
MNLDLTGKRALVCGSSKGIGRAIAFQLASQGARVVLMARNSTALEQVSSDLPGDGHQYQVADFSQPTELAALLQQPLFQEDPISVLINNTGGPPGGPIQDAKLEAFKSAFNNHLLCNQILAQALLPGMKEDGYGRIVNIISTSVKQPIAGLGVSNTIRAAVANWAKTLAGEVAAFGVTVNNVLPGATSTERLAEVIGVRAKQAQRDIAAEEKAWAAAIPMKRFGDPSEIANAVGFLASPAASYISGINLPVDGGRLMCL